MAPTALAIIPARYGSTRFPGKPLADATGMPLIQHVCEQAARATRVHAVIVATDDERIRDAVTAFGGQVVMTRHDHPNGTSRLAEVAADRNDEIIVNVQGDEPEIDPAVIDAAVDALAAKPSCEMATIASPFAADEDPADPNVVKVVLRCDGTAMYFSRAVIPFDRDGARDLPPLRHVGLYVYRRAFLLRYPTLAPTPLEQSEQLEQLRVLEHGGSIAVAVMPTHHGGIDTPEQYAAFVKRYRQRHSQSSS